MQEERAGTQSELQRLAPALAAEKSARMKAESEVQALRTRIASYEQVQSPLLSCSACFAHIAAPTCSRAWP